jgi:hypothetical protein
MSYDADRIGHTSGEWFERYVQSIFSFAGFRTERRRRFRESVTHEIDIWAESDFGAIAVECKDWAFLQTDPIKQAFDAFITKVGLVKANCGVLAVNLPRRAVHERYRAYLKENRLTLWDTEDVEKWHADIERYDKLTYQKKLCDSLGLMIREPTNQEKTVKILKTLGRAAYKTAKVSAQIAENLTQDEYPQRSRRRKYRARRY